MMHLNMHACILLKALGTPGFHCLPVLEEKQIYCERLLLTRQILASYCIHEHCNK